MGDSLMASNNCAGALDTYEKAFQFAQNNPTDLYKAAAMAACTRNFRRVFQLLDLAYDNGWDDLPRLKRDQNFADMREMGGYKTFVEKVRSKNDAREASYDKSLQARLLQMLDADRNIRNQEIVVFNKYGAMSPQLDSIHRMTSRIDSVNTQKLKAILDQYGWVGPEKVGKAASETQILVMFHADPKVIGAYLPMIRQAAADGKVPKPYLGNLEDMAALGQGKKQIYGTQIEQNPATGNYYVLPLEDPDHVDQRRALLGLDPMSEYLKYWKINWDVAAFKKQQEAAGN
jgi:hypothetical protein